MQKLNNLYHIQGFWGRICST